MIEYSVCLPMFRAKYIAWLAFESLCRQKDVEFDWELIIAEEQTEEVFGRKNVFDYEDRLKQVGCHRIHYIPLQKWIPLAKKECLLFNNCSEESKYMRTQAADCYSSPHILAESYKILRNNPKIDWFECKPYIIFYDIETGTAKMVSSKGYVPSVKLKIAKGIKSSPIRRGCDTWFRKNYNSVCKKMFDRKIVSYTDNT